MELKNNIDKVGLIGLILTAFFSPCCFPLFAFAASALGLGSFELFGGWTMWIFQAMVLISVGGLYISYRKHRCLYPLLVSVPSGISIFIGYHFIENESWIYFLYTGMLGLMIGTIWNYRRNKIHNRVVLESTITCPSCGFQKVEIMPTDSCVYFYDCDSCKQVLKPKHGDCCVYCSYGSVPCPPIQKGENCC